MLGRHKRLKIIASRQKQKFETSGIEISTNKVKNWRRIFWISWVRIRIAESNKDQFIQQYEILTYKYKTNKLYLQEKKFRGKILKYNRPKLKL